MKKILSTLVAVFSCISLCFMAGCSDRKFEESNASGTGTTPSATMQIQQGETNGIRLMSTVISEEEYGLYGISPLAETAYTLTATIEPSYASDKSVDWSLEWKNPLSDWTSGKTLSNYIEVLPASDGALTATVSCVNPFSVPINVVVQSRSDSSIRAECTCNFAQRIQSFATLTVGGAAMTNGKFYNTFVSSSTTSGVTATINSSDYTVADEFTYVATMLANENLVNALTAQGFTVTQSANTYFSFNTAGNFALSIVSNPALVAQGQLKAQFITAMQSIGAGIEIGKIKVVATGTHSTYTQIIPIVVDETCTAVAVSSLSVDQSTVVF